MEQLAAQGSIKESTLSAFERTDNSDVVKSFPKGLEYHFKPWNVECKMYLQSPSTGIEAAHSRQVDHCYSCMEAILSSQTVAPSSTFDLNSARVPSDLKPPFRDVAGVYSRFSLLLRLSIVALLQNASSGDSVTQSGHPIIWILCNALSLATCNGLIRPVGVVAVQFGLLT